MSINTLAHVFTPHGNIVYTANDFRQTVRIAVAGTIALSISTFYDVQYGVFFVVYPLMLMSLVPMFNLHVARQFIFSAAVNCVEMVLIVGYLSQWPVIMTRDGRGWRGARSGARSTGSEPTPESAPARTRRNWAA